MLARLNAPEERLQELDELRVGLPGALEAPPRRHDLHRAVHEHLLFWVGRRRGAGVHGWGSGDAERLREYNLLFDPTENRKPLVPPHVSLR